MSNILIVTGCGTSLLTFIATSVVTNGDCSLIPTVEAIFNSVFICGGVGVGTSIFVHPADRTIANANKYTFFIVFYF
jgi:hypothetical protein